MPRVLVAALYHFSPLEELETLQESLTDRMQRSGVLGTILLAGEGINGTIAGAPEGVQEVLAHLRAQAGLAALEHKESWCDETPFRRTKVRLKNEIVTLGVEGIDPRLLVGRYVDPSQWNELIRQEDVVLIDTRNGYETRVGTFEGAVDPETQSFRDFPAFVEARLDPAVHRKVAMFCTGGIRCEKATSYLLSKGFEEVYHLQGGILKYLEDVPSEESLWRGECFVFDDRVTVNHDLEPGSYGMCRACRTPLSREEQQSPLYIEGAQCPHCHATRTEEDRARYLERERQMQLAAERGEAHLGASYEAAGRS